MTTNTIVLIVVAVLVALVLAGIAAAFTYKFRADRRVLQGAGILDEAQDAIADELRAKSHVARVDKGIKAFRDRGRRRESADARATADLREQLKDHGD
jgi:hypothetical protein